MSNIEELIIRRKKENIVLNVIIIIICLISLIFFCNDYEKVLYNDYFVINSKESLEEAIKNKERYAVMDLQNSNLEMYSLKDIKTNEQLNLYTLTYDNKKVMIFLRNNTALTSKVYLNIEALDGQKISIEKLLDNGEYYNKILSNENFTLNRNIDLIKMYVFVSLIILSIILIIFDIIYYKNPKKTIKYKKYMKKLYI